MRYRPPGSVLVCTAARSRHGRRAGTVVERGVLTASDEVWAVAVRRAQVIGRWPPGCRRGGGGRGRGGGRAGDLAAAGVRPAAAVAAGRGGRLGLAAWPFEWWSGRASVVGRGRGGAGRGAGRGIGPWGGSERWLAAESLTCAEVDGGPGRIGALPLWEVAWAQVGGPAANSCTDSSSRAYR
ncbi:hypothetical protein F9B16_02560 [Actinomadura montaniterrae]|uniref:Uncharacterized protein n=1 Tax=Actinomadura montaniterrae TaxID=1803903 RepID=A0A6L3WA02_9ACTN|nr:hypothetical protein F9B16_02560 [Actinomadura montaniterrae]